MKLIVITRKELNNISKEPAMTRHFIQNHTGLYTSQAPKTLPYFKTEKCVIAYLRKKKIPKDG